MSSPYSFTYGSTFAGCGGSSLGYKWAGGHGVFAVEFDDNAVETYRSNFPETPVLHRDIKTVTAEELLELTGMAVGQLDILDGSPPCQGFSTAGKRQMHDPRNSLFMEFVRLIEGLQPKVFVMENVSGMVKGKMKLVFREVMLALKATGYRVRCKLLNAKWFNVPQSRERLIWIGVRKDIEKSPEFPDAQSKPMTVREALAECPVGATPPFNDKDAKLWDMVPPGHRADYVLGNSGFGSCNKLHPDRPSKSLPKQQTGRGFATVCHWAEPRAISIPEAKRLGSFPDDFTLVGDYSTQWERIGNSVPPRFMQAIAEHIRDHILT